MGSFLNLAGTDDTSHILEQKHGSRIFPLVLLIQTADIDMLDQLQQKVK